MSFSEYYQDNYQNIYVDDNEMNSILHLLENCIKRGAWIYVIGNGGSAYSASHFAQDLVKICDASATSLSENIGLILAVANDIDFNDIFKYQLQRQDLTGILVAISCSGNSENVLRAVDFANSIDMPVISFTGGNGGRLFEISDYNINILNSNIFIVESFHSIIMHYLVDRIKQDEIQ